MFETTMTLSAEDYWNRAVLHFRKLLTSEEEISKNSRYSRKLKVDMWIDDRNVGGLPDWGTIYRIITERKTYEEILTNDNLELPNAQERKRKWWHF